MVVFGDFLQPFVCANLAGTTECHEGESGGEQHGHQQGTNEGVADGVGHGGEEFALHVLEGKEGRVGGNDDDGGEEGRLDHLGGAQAHLTGGEDVVGVLLTYFKDGFHDDNGTID